MMNISPRRFLAIFATVMALSPAARAIDFYATSFDNNLYGVNIDGTISLIGPTGITTSTHDIAVDPVSQSTYILAQQTSGNAADLYSATIGQSSVSTQLIGAVNSTFFIEGGMTFNSFQGSNKLYAIGLLGTTQMPELYSVDTATGAGTVIPTTFSSNPNHEVNSIFTAPDGSLWGFELLTNTSNGNESTGLFRFAANGTVDRTVTLAGFESPATSGVAVKNGVTYFLSGSKWVSRSIFGTFDWDSGLSTYTGNYNVISSSNITYMTGLALAPATSVPEPSTYALGLIATGLLASLARRRKPKA